MNNNNNIEEIFRSKLKNFESTPPSNAWTNIQSQVNAAANTSVTSASSTAAKGLSVATKLFIAATITTITFTSAYFIFTGDSGNKTTSNTPNSNTISKQQTLPKETSDTKENENVISEEKETLLNNSENKLSTKNNEQLSQAETIENTTEPTTPVEKLNNQSTNKDVVNNEQNNSELNEKTVTSAEQNKKSQSIEKEIASKKQTNTNPEPEISNTESNNTSSEITSIDEFNDNENEELTEESVNSLTISPIPNVITPNHDGVNDIVKINVENYSEFKAQVFDLSGNLIFEWDTPEGFWDGNDLYGNTVPKGNYAIVITVKDAQGNITQKKSFVSLYK